MNIETNPHEYLKSLPLPSEPKALLQVAERELVLVRSSFELVKMHEKEFPDMIDEFVHSIWIMATKITLLESVLSLLGFLAEDGHLSKNMLIKKELCDAEMKVFLASIQNRSRVELWNKLSLRVKGAQRKSIRAFVIYLADLTAKDVAAEKIIKLKSEVVVEWKNLKTPVVKIPNHKIRGAFAGLSKSEEGKFLRGKSWALSLKKVQKKSDFFEICDLLGKCRDKDLGAKLIAAHANKASYETAERKLRAVLLEQKRYAKIHGHQDVFSYSSSMSMSSDSLKALLSMEIRLAWKNFVSEYGLEGLNFAEVIRKIKPKLDKKIYEPHQVIEAVLSQVPEWFGWKVGNVFLAEGKKMSFVDVSRGSGLSLKRARIFLRPSKHAESFSALGINAGFMINGKEEGRAIAHAIIETTWDGVKKLDDTDVDHLCHEMGHAIQYISIRAYHHYDDDRAMGMQFAEFPSVLLEKLVAREDFREKISGLPGRREKTAFCKLYDILTLLDALWDIHLYSGRVPKNPLALRNDLAVELGLPCAFYKMPPGFEGGCAMGGYEAAFNSYYVGGLLASHVEEMLWSNFKIGKVLNNLHRDVFSISGPFKFNQVWKSAFNENVEKTCRSSAARQVRSWNQKLNDVSLNA